MITALETLANKIKIYNNIKGIKIDNKEIKVSLLAEDITLILSELDFVKETINVLKGFSFCAGLEINVKKINVKKSMSKNLKLNILASYPPATTSLMDYHG